MPVRNISGLTNPKPIPGYTIIPPVDTAVHKVTILTSSNEEIDITDLITSASFNLGVITQGNSTIGDFTLNFLDPVNTNYNKISHFNDIFLYGDYSTEATTKRARFKIETIGYTEDCETTLSGRGIGILLSEKSIIYKTTDSFGNLTTKTKSEVIEEILEQNFSEITDFTQIEGDSTLIEKNYEEIPFIDIMEELCGIEHYFYLDHDLVPHYFRKGYHQSDTEAISDVNKVRFTDNSTTLEKVYTKVRVYGKKEGNVPIIATSNIGTSNTNGIEKDYIVTNNSVTTTSQAQDLADEYANNLSDGVKIGKIVSLFLPSLNCYL